MDLYVGMLENGLVRKGVLAMDIVKEWRESVVWGVFRVVVLVVCMGKGIWGKRDVN